MADPDKFYKEGVIDPDSRFLQLLDAELEGRMNPEPDRSFTFVDNCYFYGIDELGRVNTISLSKNEHEEFRMKRFPEVVWKFKCLKNLVFLGHNVMEIPINLERFNALDYLHLQEEYGFLYGLNVLKYVSLKEIEDSSIENGVLKVNLFWELLRSKQEEMERALNREGLNYSKDIIYPDFELDDIESRLDDKQNVKLWILEHHRHATWNNISQYISRLKFQYAILWMLEHNRAATWDDLATYVFPKPALSLYRDELLRKKYVVYQKFGEVPVHRITIFGKKKFQKLTRLLEL